MSDKAPASPISKTDEKRATLVLPEFEKKEPQIFSAELGAAIAFRVKLSPETPGQTSDQQTNLINELRGALDPSSPWMLAYPDGQDGVIGFFWTKEQYDQFRSVVSKYPGLYGLGASRGESRVAIVPDPDQSKGDDAVIVTCEATNAAARTVLGRGLELDTSMLRPDSTQIIHAYRYHTQRDGAVPEGSRLIQGDKGTGLEEIDDVERYIRENLSDKKETDRITSELAKLPGVRSSVELQKQVLEDQTELAIISVDINGMSSKIHELSSDYEHLAQSIRELEQKGTPKDDIDLVRETQTKFKQEMDEYIHGVATFFTTLEDIARRLIIEEIGTLAADAIFPPDWRGDAGGLIVPAKYQDLLAVAFDKTIALFPEINVKAYIKRYSRIEVKKGSKGRVLQGPDMNLDESVYGKLIKQNLNTGSSDSEPNVSGLLIIDETSEFQIHRLKKYKRNGRQEAQDFTPERWNQEVENIKRLMQEMNTRPRD